MRLCQVTGVNQVVSNLMVADEKIAMGVARGLKRGGRFLQRESQKIVPVQTGNLKNSAFTRNVGGSGFHTDILVGYTANYSVYVHENLEAAHGQAFNIKYAAEIKAKIAGKHDL